MIELFLGIGFCSIGVIILLKTRRDVLNLADKLVKEDGAKKEILK